MGYEAERKSIEAHLKSEWTAKYPAMKIGYDSKTFEPPVDASSIELEIVNGDAIQASFGDPTNNIERNTGLIVIRIRTVGGDGSDEMRTIADAVKSSFINKRLGSVQTRIPFVQTKITEAPFLGWSMAIPFTRDELTA